MRKRGSQVRILSGALGEALQPQGFSFVDENSATFDDASSQTPDRTQVAADDASSSAGDPVKGWTVVVVTRRYRIVETVQGLDDLVLDRSYSGDVIPEPYSCFLARSTWLETRKGLQRPCRHSAVVASRLLHTRDPHVPSGIHVALALLKPIAVLDDGVFPSDERLRGS